MKPKVFVAQPIPEVALDVLREAAEVVRLTLRGRDEPDQQRDVGAVGEGMEEGGDEAVVVGRRVVVVDHGRVDEAREGQRAGADRLRGGMVRDRGRATASTTASSSCT